MRLKFKIGGMGGGGGREGAAGLGGSPPAVIIPRLATGAIPEPPLDGQPLGAAPPAPEPDEFDEPQQIVPPPPLPPLDADRSAAAGGGRLVGMMGEGHAASTAHRDPTRAWKILAIALAVANLAAFLLLVKPVGGGSVADLEARLADLQTQIKGQQLSLRTAKNLVGKVEDARSGQERFMLTYFLDRRTMSSTILAEIKESAGKAGLVPKEHSFGFEPIEGSENLGLMTITANYEGNYSDLVHFVYLIDKSPRFLIIDNIQAAPQQQSQRLTARFKINAFVREMPPVLTAVPAVNAGAAGAAAPAEPLVSAPAPAAAATAPPVQAKPSPMGGRQ